MSKTQRRLVRTRRKIQPLIVPAGVLLAAAGVGYLAQEAMTFGTGIALFAVVAVLISASVRSHA